MRHSDYMESMDTYTGRSRAKLYDILYYLGEEWVGWGNNDRGRFRRPIEAFNRRYKKKGAK